MRILTTSLLAGVASIVVVGAVAAQTPANQAVADHVMTFQLPDGSIEQIDYAGTVAPRVAFMPTADAAPIDVGFWGFGPTSPFAAMERISAEMNREANAMFARAMTLEAQPAAGNGLVQIDAANLPRGAESYTYVATTNGDGVCSRSVEEISRGPGQAPKVISHMSGDCSAMPGNATPTLLPNAGRPPATSGHLWSAQATRPQPRTGLVREAAWQPQE
jgi:hypothetical protein